MNSSASGTSTIAINEPLVHGAVVCRSDQALTHIIRLAIPPRGSRDICTALQQNRNDLCLGVRVE